jgi:hypothetical protein
VLNKLATCLNTWNPAFPANWFHSSNLSHPGHQALLCMKLFFISSMCWRIYKMNLGCNKLAWFVTITLSGRDSYFGLSITTAFLNREGRKKEKSRRHCCLISGLLLYSETIFTFYFFHCTRMECLKFYTKIWQPRLLLTEHYYYWWEISVWCFFFSFAFVGNWNRLFWNKKC